MSDVIKWSELKPEDRDRLVATKVMGWQAQECDGEIGELPVSPDGWYCQKCGYSGSWGDGMEHEEQPKRYSRSIGMAWQIIDHLDRQFDITRYYTDDAERVAYYAVFGRLLDAVDAQARTPQEAICLAALRAVGLEIIV